MRKKVERIDEEKKKAVREGGEEVWKMWDEKRTKV